MGHNVVCRPPCWTHDGQAEFVIIQVIDKLELRWSGVKDLASVIKVLEEIIEDNTSGTGDLFKKCACHHN